MYITQRKVLKHIHQQRRTTTGNRMESVQNQKLSELNVRVTTRSIQSVPGSSKGSTKSVPGSSKRRTL